MFVISALAEFSIGSLISGYVTETATLMVFGMVLIISSVGLRRVLKYQEERKNSDETKTGNR